MKPVSYAALFLSVLSTALGQTLGPSPTESVGCEPHGDHWHCDGPRVTSAPAGAVTSPGFPIVTSSTAHDDDHDHDHDHTEDHDDHTDHAGTASLKPSPTESYGCEPHGDHWHCKGPVTASTLVTTTPLSSTTGAASVASSTSSVSTAAAAHFKAVGLGFAGLAAVAAMAM